jgi:triosephosphate isomerase
MRPLIGTSWKMNLTSSEADSWLRTFIPLATEWTDRDLFVLPPYPAIWVAREHLRGTAIGWGAQDVHPADGGAFTGSVSAPMLADLGCRYVEVGHSERRRLFGETPDLIAAKVAAILRWGMRPVLCVGEPEPGPQAKTNAVLLGDLERCLEGVDAVDLPRVIVAYEPWWAIGEGATAADAATVGEIHRSLADWLTDHAGGPSGPVIYGGSVDAASAGRLLSEPGVDGLFVGRYALDPVNFARIAGTPIGSSGGQP